MKVSFYTIPFKYNGGCFVYNTLSNALIEIDETNFDLIERCRLNKSDVEGIIKDVDLLSELSNQTIITDSDKDDFLKFKAYVMRVRRQRTSMHLTLAPTMDCCFNCYYCFEKYKKEGVMSHETIDSIVKYVSKMSDLQTINVTWFGGEPLMAVEQIEEFYNKFRPLWGDRVYVSNIITTGYHLTPEVINILKRVEVSSVQITLDGLRDTHNRIKSFKGRDDVFSKVLDNIDLYSQLDPNVNITIRVNLTHDNEDEYLPLQTMLRERYAANAKVAPAPAFVMDRGVCNCECNSSQMFNHTERSKFLLDLARKNIKTSFRNFPSRFFYECAIRNDMAISFDADGYAYKCWEVIGNKDYAIGVLNADGDLENINHRILNRHTFGADPFEDEKCKNCLYFPICNGGCPIQRIENEYENGKINCCSFYKGYLKEFLSEHLRRMNNNCLM